MRTTAKSLLALLLLTLPLAACDTEPAPEGDELEGETSLDGEALGKADGVAENFTFYAIRQDARKCMYPMCGGHWVSRVNRAYTRCADGSYEEECYVEGTDWSASGLEPEDVGALMANQNKLLVRANMAAVDVEGFGPYGRLSVGEAWFGGADTEASGLFTRVRDVGIQCITAPCLNTMFEGKLNSLRGTEFSELYLYDTEVGDEEVEGAYAQVYGDDGLIVAGYRYWYWDGAWIKGRYVTQFYERYLAR